MSSLIGCVLHNFLPGDVCKIVLKFAEIRRFSNTHVATFECEEVHEFNKIQMDKRNRIYFLHDKLRMLKIYEWWVGETPHRMKTPFEKIDDFCIHGDDIYILRDSLLHVYDLDFHFVKTLPLPCVFDSRIVNMYCSSDWLILHTSQRASFRYNNLWVISLKNTFSQSIPRHEDDPVVGTIVNESELWLLHFEYGKNEIDKFTIANGQRIHGSKRNLNQVEAMHFQHDTLFCVSFNKETDAMDMVCTISPGQINQKSYIIPNAAPKMFSKFAMSESGLLIFTLRNSIQIKK